MKTETKTKRAYKTKKMKAKKTRNKYLSLLILGFIIPNTLIGYYSNELNKEVSEDPISIIIAQKPKIEEITAIVMYEEVAKYNAVTTAYSEFDSCHYPNCEMASTKRAYVGAIACPRNIKLGTKVSVDNKDYICEDRVSLKYPDRFDIFMGYGEEAYNKAINYGNQTKEIKIFKKVI